MNEIEYHNVDGHVLGRIYFEDFGTIVASKLCYIAPEDVPLEIRVQRALTEWLACVGATNSDLTWREALKMIPVSRLASHGIVLLEPGERYAGCVEIGDESDPRFVAMLEYRAGLGWSAADELEATLA